MQEGVSDARARMLSVATCLAKGFRSAQMKHHEKSVDLSFRL